MMQIFRYFLILFFLTVSAIAAKIEVAAPNAVKPVALSPAKGSIQPRADSAEWLYISYSFEAGKRSSAGASKEEVIAVKEVDGVSCYLVKLTVDWRSFLDRISGIQLSEDDYSYYWEYFNDQGSYNYSVDTPNPNEPFTLDDFSLPLPYPVELGTSYLAEGMRYTVIDDDASIELALGKFECVVYEYLDPQLIDSEDATRERFYMAPGVGLVRWEMDYKVGESWELSFRDDLIKYRLAKLDAPVAETIKTAEQAELDSTDPE